MRRSAHRLGAFVLAAAAAARVLAQQPGVVATVADSPTALEHFHRAKEQAASNPTESARLIAELLRDLGSRLVETEQPGTFQSVADRAAVFLASHPAVLDRYRAETGAQAAQWLAEGRLLEVATRFAATDAGLSAELTLAGHALQDGRLAEASSWLQRAAAHPSSEQDASARLALEALLAWGAGDQPTWDALLADPRMDHACSARLRSMPRPEGRQPGAGVPRSAVPGDPWVEAWSTPMPWSPASIRNRGVAQPIDGTLRGPAGRSEGTLLHTVQPAIDGGVVFVADGRSIAAIDLLTRSVLWRTMLSLDHANRSADTLATPCLVDEARVHTVVTIGDVGQAAYSIVTAVRRQDGAIDWQRSLADRDEVLPGGLRMAGQPARAGDVLVVPCVRQNGRLELAVWLVGLDAMTGGVRWAASLGAANGLMQEFGASPPIRGGMGPLCALGRVLVGTQVGTTACLDPSTGAVEWLARSEVARTRLQVPLEPWEYSLPVLDRDAAWFLGTDARTVVRRTLAGGAADRELLLGPGEPLGAPRYLLGGAGHLIGVGSRGAVHAVTTDEPTRQAWAIPMEAADPVVGRIELALSSDQPVLVLPRATRIDVHDLSSGARLASHALPHGGNIAIGDGRVVVASEMQLDAYGNAERVVADLVALVERDPASDADIALAEAALRQMDGTRALAMARRALGRLGTDPSAEVARTRVFDVLLALLASTPDGDDIIEVLQASAAGPGQKTAVAMALADRWAARSSWVAAADALTSAMPALADDELIDHAGASVRMGQVLSMAMARLADRAERAGSNALEEIAARDRRRQDEPEAFARAWRGTRAAIDALTAGAQRAAAAGSADDASRMTHRAVLLALERGEAGLPVPSSQIDPLVRLLGRPGDALAVDSLRRLGLLAGGVASDAWRQLAAEDPWVLSPRLASIDGGHRAQAQAIQWSAQPPALDPLAAAQADPDRGLVLLHDQLVGLKSPHVEPVWAMDLDDPSPAIVRLLPSMILLERSQGVPARVRGGDAATGTVAWTIEDVSLVLGPVQQEDGGRHDDAMATRRSELAAVPCGDGIVTARGDGSCARIGHDGGLLWQSLRSLPLVDHVQAGCGVIALTGHSGTSDPLVLLLSSHSGTELGSATIGGLSSIDEARVTLAGTLVSRGLSSAMVELTESGPRVLWERAGPPDATRRSAMVAVGEALFLGHAAEGSVRLDLDDGSTTPLAWAQGAEAAWSPLLVREGTVLVAQGERVLLVRSSGAVIGGTRLSPSASPQLAIPCAEGIIVQAMELPAAIGARGGTTLTLLDPAQGLRQVRVVASLPIPVAWRRAFLVGNWLLEFGDDQCLAVPLGPG